MKTKPPKKKLPKRLQKEITSISIMESVHERGVRAAREDSRSFSGYVEALITTDLKTRENGQRQ